MSSPANTPQPKGSVHRAVIKIILSEWYAEFRSNDGITHRLPITELDAWNFDVENNLPVDICFYRGRVQILKKVVGNKRYVLTTESNIFLQQNL